MIQVNTPSNSATNTEAQQTPIFFRKELGTLTISFAYSSFIIATKESIKTLTEEYEEIYVDNEANKPKFMEWLNEKYMDNRGIPEHG